MLSVLSKRLSMLSEKDLSSLLPDVLDVVVELFVEGVTR